jgi:hypothetical protein
MLFEIEKHHIFIDADKFSILENLVLNGKNRHDFAREIYGKDVLWISVWQEVMVKIYKKVEQLLSENYLNNPSKFLTDNMNFEYVSDKAEKNVFDLLYAYCLTNKNADLCPISDTIATHLYTKQDFGSYSFIVTSSNAYLSFNTKNKTRFQKFIDKRFDVTIEISSKSVKRANGNLTDFVISLDDFILHFGEFVEIKLVQKKEN